MNIDIHDAFGNRQRNDIFDECSIIFWKEKNVILYNSYTNTSHVQFSCVDVKIFMYNLNWDSWSYPDTITIIKKKQAVTFLDA